MSINDELIASFKEYVPPSKGKKSRWCCIHVDGKRVVTISGKCFWRTHGHAKTALRNHLSDFAVMKGRGYSIADDYYDRLMMSGRVKIVDLEERPE